MTISNLMKMAQSSSNGLKTLWEKKKLLVRSNFSFSHSVFKRPLLQTHKNQGLFGKRLTHYQTTNFRLFQTERVCRQQFQIWRKWHKVIQTGRKHCGKRRNFSLRAISPFPTVFSKGLFPRGVKRCHFVGMGYDKKTFLFLFTQCFQKSFLSGSLKLGIVW